MDLALEFARRGHSMHVAAMLERKTGLETHTTVQRGIRVLWTRTGDLMSVGPFRKGLTMLSLERRFLRSLKASWPRLRFDLVICPTPPITFAGVVERLRQEQGCATYLILRDIFPQDAIDLGVMRDGIAHRYFRRVERRLYRSSDRIGCMSQANVDHMTRHAGVPASRLDLLPNWKRVQPLDRAPRRDFRRDWDLGDRLLTVFGGNVGIAQELGFLLDVARLNLD